MSDASGAGPGTGSSRRTFLQGTGLAGAGVAAGVLGPAGGAAALTGDVARQGSSGARPDPEDPRFALTVIPDTQYLFDADRGDPAPLEATLRWIVDHRVRENIVFTAHLGDVVENAAAAELAQAGRVFRVLDRRRIPYSVLAGNHDIDSSTDDQRGRSPYLDVFGPARFRSMDTFRGATPDGYNTVHRFRAGSRAWLLFALDWRPSDRTLAWARSVLAAHPRTPAILTTHEFADADGDANSGAGRAGGAHPSAHGQRLWDALVRDHDQIFLVLSGHFWPPGRTVLRNAAGNDVHVHLTNYQDRYYGGGAMIRLYRFDLDRDTIDVDTFSPWIRGLRPQRRNSLQRREIELTDPVNRFSLSVDFEARFASFAPVPAPPPRPPRQLLVPGTVAYWRFDRAGSDGGAVSERDRIEDLSGRGNDLTRVTLPGSGAAALRWSAEHHRDQPAHGSLRFDGGKNPARGAYLRTGVGAPLNRMTFARGYTVEAFVKLPAGAQDGHAWMGVLSRMGSGRDAGKTGGDPAEPVTTLSISDGLGVQWAVFPLNQNGISTNWGHEMRTGVWFHVAVVNDGRTSVLHIDGVPVLRNPATPAIGLSSTGEPWLIGATTYDRVVEQSFHGWIGDVRIVDRPLPANRFMTPGG